MEIQAINQAPAPSAPRTEPDQRASADAAATRLDPRPVISLPIPPDNGQKAAVNQSMMTSSPASRVASVQPVERVLKPYGVTILPQSETDVKIAETADDAPQNRPSDRA